MDSSSGCDIANALGWEEQEMHLEVLKGKEMGCNSNKIK
jgi:hypothetical protein